MHSVEKTAGGFCASGGPYQIANQCTGGETRQVFIGVIVMLVFGGLFAGLTGWADRFQRSISVDSGTHPLRVIIPLQHLGTTRRIAASGARSPVQISYCAKPCARNISIRK